MMDQGGLEKVAARLAAKMGRGSRLFLTGELGTGKSVFARAVLRELGVEGGIPSPSFIVDAVYFSRGLEIHHVDLYRLRGTPDELEFYGIEDILDSPAAAVIEWAERLPPDLLKEGTRVVISFTDDPLMREVRVDGKKALAGN